MKLAHGRPMLCCPPYSREWSSIRCTNPTLWNPKPLSWWYSLDFWHFVLGWSIAEIHCRPGESLAGPAPVWWTSAIHVVHFVAYLNLLLRPTYYLDQSLPSQHLGPPRHSLFLRQRWKYHSFDISCLFSIFPLLSGFIKRLAGDLYFQMKFFSSHMLTMQCTVFLE